MVDSSPTFSSHIRYLSGRPVLVILALSTALFGITSLFSGSGTGHLSQQALQALSSSRKSQFAGREPRYVFVDLGANRADSLEVFLKEPNAKWQEDFPRPDWATYKEADIYLVEGNPVFNKALVNAKQKYQNKGINVQIFPSTIADVDDGIRTFFLDTVNENADYWGSSVLDTHPDAIASGGKGTKLTSINIARWLLMNTLPQDFVVVKMDIEGSEAEVLPQMVEMGVSAVLDYLLVEVHTHVLDGASVSKARAAVAKLKLEGVKMPEYYSPG